jgi:hypothetical protein
LEVNLLLNCNKLKALKTNEDEIIQAVKFSKVVEPSKDHKSVRRLENKELPELSLLNQKRKLESSSNTTSHKENSTKDRNMGALEDVFLVINSDKEVEFKWKAIQDEYQKLNPELNIVYMRFNKTEGNIGIFHNTKNTLEFKKGLTFDGVVFTVKKCEGDDLITFWKDHGGHYENCVKRVKREQMKKTREKLRDDKTKNFLKNEVTVGTLK